MDLLQPEVNQPVFRVKIQGLPVKLLGAIEFRSFDELLGELKNLVHRVLGLSALQVEIFQGDVRLGAGMVHPENPAQRIFGLHPVAPPDQQIGEREQMRFHLRLVFFLLEQPHQGAVHPFVLRIQFLHRAQKIFRLVGVSALQRSIR